MLQQLITLELGLVFALALSLAGAARAATHQFHWTAAWGTANLDGLKERPVITCNGEFPWPAVRIQRGDRVEIFLTNGFQDGSNTSLHVHGMFQSGTNAMDGVPFLTQCPIGANDTMLYNFTVPDQHGAFWYHSHTLGQYQDGFRGLFIIDEGENNSDYPHKYDEETVLSIGDWYHQGADILSKKFLSLYNPTGAEPIPQNLLINETRNLTWEVKPDTTYLLRLVNIGGFVSQYFWIEDHNMTVVEVDGIVTEPMETNMLYITTAQRYTVLVHTKNSTDKNYAIMQKFDDTMLDVLPKDLELNATSFMVYDKGAPMPEQDLVDSIDDFLDDFNLVPYDKTKLYPEPTRNITVDVIMDNLANGVNYAFFNNITYVAPKVPTLMSVLSAEDEHIMNPLVYGTNTNSFVLEKDEVIDLIINNQDTGKHPFHLHGHVFQTIYRDVPHDADGEEPVPYDTTNVTIRENFPQTPMLRDTVYLNPQSSMILRFKADNPGIWFFHCHLEWHLLQGLALQFVEDPKSIKQNASQKINKNHLEICANVGVPIEGNAAANAKNYLDLTGQNIQVKSLPKGFTAKGIVAMTFSCLAGALGILTISIYGVMDIETNPVELAKDLHVNPEAVLDDDDDSSFYKQRSKENFNEQTFEK